MWLCIEEDYSLCPYVQTFAPLVGLSYVGKGEVRAQPELDVWTDFPERVLYNAEKETLLIRLASTRERREKKTNLSAQLFLSLSPDRASLDLFLSDGRFFSSPVQGLPDLFSRAVSELEKVNRFCPAVRKIWKDSVSIFDAKKEVSFELTFRATDGFLGKFVEACFLPCACSRYGRLVFSSKTARVVEDPEKLAQIPIETWRIFKDSLVFPYIHSSDFWKNCAGISVGNSVSLFGFSVAFLEDLSFRSFYWPFYEKFSPRQNGCGVSRGPSEPLSLKKRNKNWIFLDDEKLVYVLPLKYASSHYSKVLSWLSAFSEAWTVHKFIGEGFVFISRMKDRILYDLERERVVSVSSN